MGPCIRAGLLFVAASIVAGFAGSSAASPRRSTAATCLSESSSPENRIAACTKLIRLHAAKKTGDPMGEALLLSRAAAFGQIGDYARAIADASRAINVAPSPAAYYTRALAYHNIGDNDRAIADCNSALAIDPANANALFVRAASYQSKAEHPRAIRDYTEVLRLEPGRVDALFSRGAAHYSAGEFGRAVNDFSRVIDLGAAEGTVFYLRSLAYDELGRSAEAKSDMAEALRRDPELQSRPPDPRSASDNGRH
jgi:tetratricopeptide (TPR) repeat protein